MERPGPHFIRPGHHLGGQNVDFTLKKSIDREEESYSPPKAFKKKRAPKKILIKIKKQSLKKKKI